VVIGTGYQLKRFSLSIPNPIDPKVRALIPMYKPLQVSKCEKCGKTIAEPKELIRIQKTK
jgi:hypothetical protein